MDIVSYALSKKFTNKVAATKADIVNGKVPASQLPSYVDDVVEYADITTFPEDGEAGKIYVALDTGCTYRWAGSDYIQIGGQDLSDLVANFAPNYDNTATYAVGDFCTHENIFYVCSTAIDVAEAWNADHWTRTTIATVIEARDAQIAALQQSVAKLGADLAPAYDPTLTYKVGDLVMVDDELWKCVTKIETAEAWNPEHWAKVQIGDVFADKNYFGFFRVIDPPASAMLTTEEVELFKNNNVAIKGTFLGQKDPIFKSGGVSVYSPYNYFGVVILPAGIRLYQIDANNVISLSAGGMELFQYGTVRNFDVNLKAARDVSLNPGRFLYFRSKAFPAYPTTNANPANLQIAPNGGNLSWKEVINNLAPEYDATATYAVGDVCLHDGALYQCTTAIATAEAWDATHWAQVKVDDVYADKNYFGFRIINAPTLPLSQDTQAIIKKGVIVNGNFLGLVNPVIFPSEDNRTSVIAGMSGGGDWLMFKFRLSANPTLDMNQFFGLNNYGGVNICASGGSNDISSHVVLNHRGIRKYPTDTTQAYTLGIDANDSTWLSWKPVLYGPSVSDNAITELTYEKISVIILSADKTFTLKAAQTDCIPEYKALISNSGSSAITLTFTGVGTIHTNDPNISLVAGTNSTATIPANTKVEVNIFDGDAIVYNKNAISYATNAEVEALFE